MLIEIVAYSSVTRLSFWEREEAAPLPTSWWVRFPRAKDNKKALPWQEVPDSNCERRNVTLTNAPRPQSQSPATASKTAGTGGILQSRAGITIIGDYSPARRSLRPSEM